MNQPDPLYPGLSAGTCVTKVAGDLSRNTHLVVSNATGPMMTITPDGKLQMPGIKPSEVAELLIDMFARSYGSKLLMAEARALAAETHVKSLERRVKDAEDRAKAAETLAKRGVVNVLAMNPKSNRSRWFANKREQDPSVAEQLDDLSSDKARQYTTSGDKPDDEPG